MFHFISFYKDVVAYRDPFKYDTEKFDENFKLLVKIDFYYSLKQLNMSIEEIRAVLNLERGQPVNFQLQTFFLKYLHFC